MSKLRIFFSLKNCWVTDEGSPEGSRKKSTEERLNFRNDTVRNGDINGDNNRRRRLELRKILETATEKGKCTEPPDLTESLTENPNGAETESEDQIGAEAETEDQNGAETETQDQNREEK
ncbi:hypothetical protein BpHYR1_021448 [Brachionus plicatilis]|uniref:Uncharacterized protein n=1 Tax=Brachionus plicatilis TaxID=10195 RepID=A0A3M7SV22_BRAPC|nr:hypothetical protein BpHYR1_021448 [Brachionus plicatilis]